jgi:cell wall-associated NlpC family hydrolase
VPNDRTRLLLLKTMPDDPTDRLARIRELLTTEPLPARPEPEPVRVPAPVPSGAIPAPSAGVEAAIALGMSLIPRPYVLGAACGRSANCTSSFDCSSFVRYIFTQAGFRMPGAQTGLLADGLPRVSDADKRRGDIFVWTNGVTSNFAAVDAHTGVWLGDGHTLDCRFPTGTGIFLPLNRPHVIVRPSP